MSPQEFLPFDVLNLEPKFYKSGPLQFDDINQEPKLEEVAPLTELTLSQEQPVLVVNELDEQLVSDSSRKQILSAQIEANEKDKVEEVFEPKSENKVDVGEEELVDSGKSLEEPKKIEEEPENIADKVYRNAAFVSFAGKVASPLGSTGGDFNTHRYFMNNGEIVPDGFSSLRSSNVDAINSPDFSRVCVHNLSSNNVLRPPKGETTIRHDVIEYDDGSSGVQFYISIVNNNHLWDHRNNGYPDYFMFDAPKDVAKEFLLAVVDDAGVVLDVFLRFFHKHPKLLDNYNRPKYAVIAQNSGLDKISLSTNNLQYDKYSYAQTEAVPYSGAFIVTEKSQLKKYPYKQQDVKNFEEFVDNVVNPKGKIIHKIPKLSTAIRYSEFVSEPDDVVGQFANISDLQGLESIISVYQDQYRFVRFIRNIFYAVKGKADYGELSQVTSKAEIIIREYEKQIPPKVFKNFIDTLPKLFFDFYQSGEEMKSVTTTTELREKMIVHGEKYDYIETCKGFEKVETNKAIKTIDNGQTIKSAKALLTYVENNDFSHELRHRFNLDLLLIEEFFKNSDNFIEKAQLFRLLNKEDYNGKKSRLHERLVEFRPNLLHWKSVFSYK